MLLNSKVYILIFLPFVLLGYFAFARYRRPQVSSVWLLIASFVFYSYYSVKNLPIILLSIAVNIVISRLLLHKRAKAYIVAGLAFNILYLSYFKYYNFIVDNINILFDLALPKTQTELPLGISFFCFTQIAYLVDCFRNAGRNNSLLYYTLFVSYFPHLLAGPIIHHSDVIPQFQKLKTKIFSSKNMSIGIFLFSIGLFKKVVIADSVSVWANYIFNQPSKATFVTAWAASLAYTLQIYFDFSGYTDMALGTSYMLNIKIPFNFNSPYKARNIKDFWLRWHITLSKFLKDYIYIPLGGSRKGLPATLYNIVVTFVICGIWHGAGWTYIVWGALHGIGSVVFRLFSSLKVHIPKHAAWLITLAFINFCWVFFRSSTLSDAFVFIKAMTLQGKIVMPIYLSHSLSFLSSCGVSFEYIDLPFQQQTFVFFVLAVAIVLFPKNSIQLIEHFQPSLFSTSIVLCCLVCSFSILFSNTVPSQFIYFIF